MGSPCTASAVAPSNIALVKYWGKRDRELNLPATGSVSVTLDCLLSHTRVCFDEALPADVVHLDGREVGDEGRRIVRFLDRVRELCDVSAHAQVDSRNDFPTGAGLASSASGFAALAVACDAALGLGLSPAQLGVLARRGSGSAARSLIDGFAEMRAGRAADGSDAYAVALAPPDRLPLRVLVAVTTRAPKAVGSTEGMLRTERTSPYHAAWLESTGEDLKAVRAALGSGDLPRLGAIAERNCLRMHADMLAADPALLYWNPATVAVMQTVAALRAEGRAAWFTIDAGPQVKVLCDANDARAVAAALRSLDGVLEVLQAAPGAGARVTEDA